MGNPVTITASRELGHNALRMLLTMTILTFRHGLVFVLVTECAGEGSMFRLRCGQKVVSIFVAGCAQFVRRI